MTRNVIQILIGIGALIAVCIPGLCDTPLIWLAAWCCGCHVGIHVSRLAEQRALSKALENKQ